MLSRCIDKPNSATCYIVILRDYIWLRCMLSNRFHRKRNSRHIANMWNIYRFANGTLSRVVFTRTCIEQFFLFMIQEIMHVLHCGKSTRYFAFAIIATAVAQAASDMVFSGTLPQAVHPVTYYNRRELEHILFQTDLHKFCSNISANVSHFSEI